MQGETIIIRCSASGVPDPLVAWFHNGSPLNENIDPNLSITRGGTVLSIKNANPKMSGQFTCRAINSAGSDSFNYDVQVQVPPKVSGGRSGDEKITIN